MLLLASAAAIVAGALVVHDDGQDRVVTASPPARAAQSVGVAGDRAKEQRRPRPAPDLPTAEGLAAAHRYAARRGGLVSFAAIDSEGRLYGRDLERLYSAASTVKAMLLAAEIDRLERGGLPLDDGTDALLRSMIVFSDNDAADAIHARVGEAGMFAVAERAGMTRFTEAGHWGNAQIDAADLARFYWRLGELMDGPHREFALGLLGSVTATQGWGIPAAAGDAWAVRFKGGWLPGRGLAHQGAELRERGGDDQLALAVLTDAQPSHEYATETIRGVAARLLSGG